MINSDIKKVVLFIFYCIVFIFYYIIWMLILHFAHLAKINGMFYVYSDMLGNKVIYFGYMLAFVIMFLPVILFIYKKTVQKNCKVFLISFVSTAIFCASAFGSFFFMASLYRDFSVEKWNIYPNERYLMTDDLFENHNFSEFNKEETEELLGKPDRVSKSGNSYFYKYGSYGEIEIVFDDTKVKRIDLH